MIIIEKTSSFTSGPIRCLPLSLSNKVNQLLSVVVFAIDLHRTTRSKFEGLVF